MKSLKLALFAIIYISCTNNSNETTLDLTLFDESTFVLQELRLHSSNQNSPNFDKKKMPYFIFYLSEDSLGEINRIGFVDGCNAHSAPCEIKNDTITIDFDRTSGTKGACRGSLFYYKPYLSKSLIRIHNDTLHLISMSGDTVVCYKKL